MNESFPIYEAATRLAIEPEQVIDLIKRGKIELSSRVITPYTQIPQGVLVEACIAGGLDPRRAM